jgi:uncharacterized Zn finger protein (UPF0148 family)
MTDKVKCPICGKMVELEPHPDKPGRQVAYCTCRGSKVAVIDAPASTGKSYPSVKEKEVRND